MTEAEWLSGVDPAPLLRFVEPRLTDRLRLRFVAGCCRRIWDLLTDHRFRRVVEAAEAVAAGQAANDELEAAAGAVPGPAFAPVLVSEPPPRDHWVSGERVFRTGQAAGGARTGVLNFHELPTWCQRTYHAVEAIPARGCLTVADHCETAAADHAGEAVADRHPLHDEIRTLQDEVRRLHRTADDFLRRGAGRLSDDARAAADEAERRAAGRVRVLTNEIWTAGAVERVDRARAERAAQADLIRCLIGTPFRTVEVDPAWLTPTVRALARGVAADRAFDRLPILADALQDAGCDDPDVLAHCRHHPVHALGCWVVDRLNSQAADAPHRARGAGATGG